MLLIQLSNDSWERSGEKGHKLRRISEVYNNEDNKAEPSIEMRNQDGRAQIVAAIFLRIEFFTKCHVHQLHPYKNYKALILCILQVI